MNIFEQAAKQKIRFNFKGLILVEDLYDLSLEDLNDLYIRINHDLKEDSAEGLLETTEKSEKFSTLRLKLELIKHIFQQKKDFIQNQKDEKIRKEKKQKIMELIAGKQDQALQEKSEEELMKMLEDL